MCLTFYYYNTEAYIKIEIYFWPIFSFDSFLKNYPQSFGTEKKLNKQIAIPENKL